MTKFLNVFTTITIMTYSAYLYYCSKISLVDLSSIILITSKLTNIVYDIMTTYPTVINVCTALNASESFTKGLYESYIENAKTTKNTIHLEKGSILFDNLNFKHDNTDKPLIENFFLDIPSGQKVAIMGNSGCGKSTLVKLLMGYYPVPDDTIRIDGKCINKHKLSALRKQITFINQNTRLFNDTVLKNIQYGNNTTRENIINHIKNTGTYSIFETLSDGLDTLCGINGEYLSGGQKQLVHFIKNIEKNNKIIILDEPTAAVDSENTQNILNAIEKISKDSTLVIITHDKNVLRVVDRIITMNDGKIVNDVYTNK